MDFRVKYDALVAKIGAIFTGQGKDGPGEIPDDPQKTAEFVQALYDDGIRYETDHFAETAHMRPVFAYKDNGIYAILTPEEWRRACDALAAGNLYDVIGHRNQTPQTKWRSEVVEGIIPSNMGVRGSYISSNWHDVTITPNIQGVNEIFNQERMHEAVGWTDFVDAFREVAQRYGYADCEVQFVDDEDGGHVCVRVIPPGTIAITPYSQWIDKKHGCWYVVVGDMINQKQLEEHYPELVGEAQPGGVLGSNKYVPSITQRTGYTHTKLYTRYRAFLDDETLEERPFTDQEVEVLATEIDAMMLGQPVQAMKEQNHKVHIKHATEALQNFMESLDEENMAPEDVEFADRVIQAFADNIEQHMAMMDENDPYSMGLQKKYPYGRYICVVGGKVAHDMPNPNMRSDGYGVPWRKLFHRVYNKKAFGRNDGVGDPETLFHDEKKASIALSRFEDSIVLATPKKYRHIQDKLTKATESQVEDNDPIITGYYTVAPPVSISGHIAVEALQFRNVVVEKSQKLYGVNSISIGGEPTNQTSGFQTQLLQKQNERIVTGDLDRNLRRTLEEVIEAMLEMYKVWYTDVREYIINGEYTPINVSETLSWMVITENGQQKKVRIPKLQITVKPFSNYPNRFEIELSELVQIYGLRDEMGNPMIPSTAIKKYLANKYPEAASGEWDQLTEATKIGLQIMQQQAAMQQSQGSKIDEITRLAEQEYIGSGNGTEEI